MRGIKGLVDKIRKSAKGSPETGKRILLAMDKAAIHFREVRSVLYDSQAQEMIYSTGCLNSLHCTPDFRDKLASFIEVNALRDEWKVRANREAEKLGLPEPFPDGREDVCAIEADVEEALHNKTKPRAFVREFFAEDLAAREADKQANG